MRSTWLRRPQALSSVVFVHGFLSSSESAWGEDPGTAWPQLLHLEEHLASVGIYLFTYNSTAFSGTYRLGDIVDALKEHLRLDGLLEGRRIIFVCHSMGGIVVRRYIVERQLDLIEKQIEIGLFLLASPSLGAKYANMLSGLAKSLGNMQADTLRFAQENGWLNDLDRSFINLKESRRLHIHGKELVEDKFVVLRKFWRQQVVEPFSGARYFGEAIKIAESDHFSICKPQRRDAFQHQLLCQFIEDLLGIQKPTDSPDTTEATKPATCTVSVVSDPLHSDVHAALRIYEARIPEDERFEAPDIVRWLRDDMEQRRNGSVAPRDFFLVAKSGNSVVGFVLLHSYPLFKMAFVAYLVVEKGVKVDDVFVSRSLLEKAAELFETDPDLQKARGILLEVDDPRTANTAEERRERLARIRLFCMLSEGVGLSLRILDFKYFQPLVSIPGPNDNGSEVPLLLMQATKSDAVNGKTCADRTQVCDLLRFVYLNLYPEGFSAFESENAEYQRYLAALYERESKRVPDVTRLLTFRELRKDSQPC